MLIFTLPTVLLMALKKITVLGKAGGKVGGASAKIIAAPFKIILKKLFNILFIIGIGYVIYMFFFKR